MSTCLTSAIQPRKRHFASITCGIVGTSNTVIFLSGFRLDRWSLDHFFGKNDHIQTSNSVLVERMQKYIRANIPREYGFTHHDHYLIRLANILKNNKGTYNSGSLIYSTSDRFDKEYRYWNTAGEIDITLSYFMKPYEQHVFTTPDITDISKSLFLTRLWLCASEEKNVVLTLMERLDINNTQKILNAYSRCAWKPSASSDFENINEILQRGQDSITLELR